MRVFLLTVLVCAGAAAQQQPPSLIKFLGLTAAQTAGIQQANYVFNQFFQAKQQRINTVNNELTAEYAKPSPDPLALGQRYVELDTINQEIATQQAIVQAKVTTLLTPAQIALLGQISAAIVQSSLVQDAGCAYLGNAGGGTTLFQFNGVASGVLGAVPNPVFGTATFLSLPNFYSSCGTQFPVSTRNYLALTDMEVSGILVLESAYNSFYTQKQSRVADVQVEIRDETAKANPDPLALGVRYAELLEISQELTQTDQQDRAAARALLTGSQQAQLQTLLGTNALIQYSFLAESCNFISVPPTASYFSSFPGFSFSCSLN